MLLGILNAMPQNLCGELGAGLGACITENTEFIKDITKEGIISEGIIKGNTGDGDYS